MIARSLSSVKSLGRIVIPKPVSRRNSLRSLTSIMSDPGEAGEARVNAAETGGTEYLQEMFPGVPFTPHRNKNRGLSIKQMVSLEQTPYDGDESPLSMSPARTPNVLSDCGSPPNAREQHAHTSEGEGEEAAEAPKRRGFGVRAQLMPMSFSSLLLYYTAEH